MILNFRRLWAVSAAVPHLFLHSTIACSRSASSWLRINRRAFPAGKELQETFLRSAPDQRQGPLANPSALLPDQYELTMARAYYAEHMDQLAVIRRDHIEC